MLCIRLLRNCLNPNMLSLSKKVVSIVAIIIFFMHVFIITAGTCYSVSECQNQMLTVHGEDVNVWFHISGVAVMWQWCGRNGENRKYGVAVIPLWRGNFFFSFCVQIFCHHSWCFSTPAAPPVWTCSFKTEQNHSGWNRSVGKLISFCFCRTSWVFYFLCIHLRVSLMPDS